MSKVRKTLKCTTELVLKIPPRFERSTLPPAPPPPPPPNKKRIFPNVLASFRVVVINNVQLYSRIPIT